MFVRYSRESVLFASGIAVGLTVGIGVSRFVFKNTPLQHHDTAAKKTRKALRNAARQDCQLDQSHRGGRCATSAKRTVIESDALLWLNAQGSFPDGSCVITGIPDIIEAAPASGAGTHIMNLEEYECFVDETATMILKRLPAASCAIFVVTDIKVKGAVAGTYTDWVDKSFLLQKAAKNLEGVRLLWHKITCSDDLGVLGSLGRARYSHVLCFGNAGVGPERLDGPVAAIPDVGRRGYVTWARGMGVRCCLALCRYVKKRGCTLVVDPFCGEGAVLAVAGYCGLDSIGVELSRKRAEVARGLDGADLIANDKADLASGC